MNYPQDFYDAVQDVFVLERAALRAKKMPQGYLRVDDILEEPMMRKVVEKYGIEASRHFLVEIARIPRKNARKLLEFEPQSYLIYAAMATPANVSPLKVRPWAHVVKTLQREMGHRWAESKAQADAEEAAAAAQASRLKATAREFVPMGLQAPRSATVENIRHIWNRTGGTRRGRSRSRSRRQTHRGRRH